MSRKSRGDVTIFSQMDKLTGSNEGRKEKKTSMKKKEGRNREADRKE